MLSMTSDSTGSISNNNSNNHPKNKRNPSTEKQQQQRQQQQQQQQQPQRHHHPSSILEDSFGKTNRELAERIWNWEQEHRRDSQLPRLEYSVRSGLRLVDRMARQVQQHNSGGGGGGMDYNDLVQEGLTALLDALSHYQGEPEGFEKFAQARIQHYFVQALSQDKITSPAISRLPRSVWKTLKQAKRVAQQLQQEQQQSSSPDNNKKSHHSPSITIKQVAKALGIPTERLKDYINLAALTKIRGSGSGSSTSSSGSMDDLEDREGSSGGLGGRGRFSPVRLLSVESTVEISHPQLEDSVEYRDQDEWELWQGLLLDNGRNVVTEELVEDYVDESMQLEGDDDAWIRQEEQVAGRLQDLIPDPSSSDSPTMDDVALEEIIRSDLSNFLTSTLDAQELQVVRLAFGLDTDGNGKPPASSTQLAKTMGMSKEEVSKLLIHAVQKLRTSYRSRYIDSYSDDDNEIPTIDSV